MNDEIPTAEQIEAMTDEQRKVLENRLRRAAARQGLRLMKSRARDPRAIGFGTCMLVDERSDTVVCCGLSEGYGLDLRGVAAYLYGDDGR